MRPPEIGVMFWAAGEPRETVRKVKISGVCCGQLGLPGDLELSATSARAWKTARAEAGVEIVIAFCGFIAGKATPMWERLTSVRCKKADWPAAS